MVPFDYAAFVEDLVRDVSRENGIYVAVNIQPLPDIFREVKVRALSVALLCKDAPAAQLAARLVPSTPL